MTRGAPSKNEAASDRAPPHKVAEGVPRRSVVAIVLRAYLRRLRRAAARAARPKSAIDAGSGTLPPAEPPAPPPPVVNEPPPGEKMLKLLPPGRLLNAARMLPLPSTAGSGDENVVLKVQ